jgi:beta-lactamase class A
MRNRPHTTYSSYLPYSAKTAGRTLPAQRFGRKVYVAAIALFLLSLISVYIPASQHATAQIDTGNDNYMDSIKRRNESFDSTLVRIGEDYPELETSIVVTTSRSSRHHFGSQDTYEAASTAKLITAAAYLQMVQQGKLSLQAPIEGQSLIYWIREMVINSDDDAWNVLNTHLTHQKLNQYAHSVGLRDYNADTNSLSADDIASFMHRLASHNLLDAKRTVLFESLMQKANYRDFVVAGVPQGYNVAHKVGFTADYLHDTAIISHDNQWITLTIFTKDSGEYPVQAKAQIMQTITKAAINAYL